MNCCKATCIILALLGAFVGYSIYNILFYIPPIPDLPQDQWWGPGSPLKNLDKSIRPFEVKFNPERISELKARLQDTTWLAEPLEGIGFQYGFNSKYLEEVIEFWRTKYDFNTRQKKLNSFPQFKTNIQGLDIHFVHVQQDNPKNLRVVPLLLLHGWPGSYVEFINLIHQLFSKGHEKERDFVLSIVAPSLPGYGYSQGASKPGLGPAQISVIMANLMERLGYSKYVVQGGDWGSFIGAIMSVLYEDRIIGYHTNMAFVNSPLAYLKYFFFSFYPKAVVEERHISKLYPFGTIFSFLLEETGYLHIQSTKPDTVGIALKDSPIGLAAYILEKFSTWTNKEWRSLPDGGLTRKFEMSDLLDNIMVYWDSGCITTSVRLYSESFGKANLDLEMIPKKVPTIILRCANELVFASECELKEKFVNIIKLNDADDIGHFAAFEEPGIMAKHIWEAMELFEKNRLKNVKKEEL